jgi:hypothetical protein
MHSLRTTSLLLLAAVLLSGCVAEIEPDLPLARLPVIELGTDYQLLLSPNHPDSTVSDELVPAGAEVELLGSDGDGAWLLVDYEGQVGWIPSLVSATAVGTLKAPLTIVPLSAACANYVGKVDQLAAPWKSSVTGPGLVYGFFAMRPGALPASASLALNVTGGGTVSAADYIHVALTRTRNLIFFVFQIDNLTRKSTLSLRLQPEASRTLDFEAAFFALTCPPVEVDAVRGPLPIGKLKAAAAEEIHSFAGSDSLDGGEEPLLLEEPDAEGPIATSTPPVVINVPSGLSRLPDWLRPPPSPTPVKPVFTADRTKLARGECTYLRWEARTARKVYLNGENVQPVAARRVCPTATRVYILSVKEPDGRRNDFKLTLQVQ